MDKRALKILFDIYWSPSGWKDEGLQRVAPEDAAYAKAAGVMFDPILLDHEEVLQRLFKVRNQLNARRITDAFLASLSTRRLDLRSGLGSYAVFRHMEGHEALIHERQCMICGQYVIAGYYEDLNVLNFERIKWGGTRHTDPLYAMLDLELFLKEEPISPSQEDIGIFGALIESIEGAPPSITAATVQARWAGLLKSNKDERDRIVAMLGFCGILETSAHHGYRSQFIPGPDRVLPNRRSIDMCYPACWWTAADGVNREALHEWFGYVL
jgi:hypothetical protein